MRKEPNEAYNELTAPLPDCKIESIEVFADSVHAVLHEHNWKVEGSSTDVINPWKVNVLFKCTKCNEVMLRQAERPFI